MRQSFLNVCFMVSSTFLLASCQKENNRVRMEDEATAMKAWNAKADQDTKFNTFYGPQESVGDGHARTFATISHTGVPKEVGVVLTEDALSGLPATNTIYSLPFHNKALEATLLSTLL